MNRKYAKIISPNRIGYAPDCLPYGKKVIYNPTAEQYAKAGYYPVVDTPQPEGLYWESEWEMNNKKDCQRVVRVWKELPDPRTAEEKRKYAYETRKVIEYNKQMLSVDEARQICAEYLFEDTDRAKEIISELTKGITEAKCAIRKEYPDEVEEPEKPIKGDEEPKDDPKDEPDKKGK